MNLKQAHYLKTIAQCGSITAAAKKLYVSQPSLSQMLRQMEDAIGLPIFDRSVSPFRITYAGEKCLEAADAMLSANTQLENQLREIRNDHSGRLRLGISVQRALQVLPLVLPEFSKRYPQVVLEMTECGSASLENLLERGEIDLAMAALESTGSNMAYELIERETVGILAGRDCAVTRRLPGGTAVELGEVEEESFIFLREGHALRLTQDRLFRRAGLSPRVLLETDNLEIGKRVALSAGACMLLTDVYLDQYVMQTGGVFFPLKNYENNRHFYACYRKDEFVPRYTRDFISIAARALEEQRQKETAILCP